MSLETDFRTALLADAVDTGAPDRLTGGVYTYVSTNSRGITRQSAPGAFDSNGVLKPCALIKQRARVPDNRINDEALQAQSWQQIVEIYLYEEQYGDRTTIETVAGNLKTLFHDKNVNNRRARRVNQLEDIEPPLDNAHLIRVDFAVNAVD